MTNPTAANYRAIGDTTFAVWRAEFTRLNSPFLPQCDDMYAAAKPHTALCLAQMTVENRIGTTGVLIKAADNNPLSLRPWDNDPHGLPNGTKRVIVSPDGGKFLAFLTAAHCIAEWKRRLFDDPTYKGGAYTATVSLEAMIDTYAPPGDVHPVTGVDNADMGYATTVRTLLARYHAKEGTMSDGTATVAPVKEIPLLEEAEKTGQLVVRDTTNNIVYFRLDADVEAIRSTPRLQAPSRTAPRVGSDLAIGDDAHADWAWVDSTSTTWLKSKYDTIFIGSDFKGIAGPILLPDPEPTPVPTTPVDPTRITAKTYRAVADPLVLLPEITWEGTTNFFPNRHGLRPVAIIYHCTDDLKYANTKSWFQTSGSNASSHFVIERDGAVHQFVSSRDGAWTNGDYKKPRQDMAWLVEAIRKGINVNDLTISYEFIATPSVPPTNAQYESAIKLSRYFCHPKVYGIDPNRGHQGRHADINSVTRPYCPGPKFDLTGIIEELDGDPAQMKEAA